MITEQKRKNANQPLTKITRDTVWTEYVKTPHEHDTDSYSLEEKLQTASGEVS
jgi:hypothetical protein